MNLDRVTITGADDSIPPEALLKLSIRYPFVEWGILLSKAQEGGPRYPSLKWMEALGEIARKSRFMKLSGHLCGRWVRELVLEANYSFLTDRPSIGLIFNRIQLNFHAYSHRPAHQAFFSRIGVEPRQYIFQQDGVNDNLFRDAWTAWPKIDAVPLYDISGGRGILPERWPPAYEGVYNGYAGGLGPDNLKEEIEKIGKTAGKERFWVDMESKIRTANDLLFDLDKVIRCLDIG